MTNLDKFIAVMKRAAKQECLYMPAWQSRNGKGVIFNNREFVTTEEELHTCGNAACAGGYLAISPEWIEDGATTVHWDGSPALKGGEWGAAAVSEWLNVDYLDIYEILYGDVDDFGKYSIFYNKLFCDVTAEDVIQKLEKL